MHFSVVINYLAAAASLTLAAFVTLREKRSLVRHMLTLGLLALSAEALLAGLSALAGHPETAVERQRLRMLATAFVPGCWLVFSLTYSRGNHREHLREWMPVVLGTFLVPTLTVLIFWRRLLTPITSFDPELEKLMPVTRAGSAVWILFLLSLTVVLMNLERTLRASVGMMRWRIKYMAIGLGVLFATRIYTASQTIVYSSINPSIDSLNACALAVGCAFVFLSELRAPLQKVDVYLSDTLLYRSFTLFLVAMYLLAVGAMAHIVTFFGDVEAFPVRTFVVFVTLIGLPIMLTSDRVRQFSRRFVSTHLSRPRHDYRTVWDSFAKRTASLMSAREYSRAVASLISETFEVLSVSIWLLEEAHHRLVLGGSTSLQKDQTGDIPLPEGAVTDFVAAVRGLKRPMDIDDAEATWLSVLRERNPGSFAGGGRRLFCPLTAGGEVLGLMLLGDRVKGLPFTVEDLDLLETIGDQVGANILNFRLADRLLEAKQMEAFQTMSAFFVHDLKNTASTLSLMVQNVREHFEDPDFREDAVGAIARSAAKINDLIRRLTLLRQKLEIHPVDMDLNEQVTDLLKGLGPGATSIHTTLGALPLIPADPEQFHKVLTNLILNALDATAAEGDIQVETSQRGAWAVLSVSDSGCGMDPLFIEQSLFLPFKSTKKAGMGIGLFQTKMIVEAHGGRIDVSSEKGKGTTFRVLLPIQRGTGA